MDDTRSLLVGRVKWFDPQQGSGVIGDVGGGSYPFEVADLDQALPPFAAGQLVAFDVAGAGRAARLRKWGEDPIPT